MMEYKRGDRVAIIGTITHLEDEFGNLGIDLPNGDYLQRALKTNEVTHLEDFHPDEKEIKMTPEEKAEFDKLKKFHKSLFWALIDISDVGYPHLFKRISYNDDAEENNKAQLEFAKVWDKPSRIKVVKEKYRIKLADGYLVNVMGDWLTLKNKKDGDIFTQSEIDELQKREQFKAIDLNKCKEEVEDE